MFRKINWSYVWWSLVIFVVSPLVFMYAITTGGGEVVANARSAEEFGPVVLYGSVATAIVVMIVVRMRYAKE